jgi:hypothetical protein
MGLLGKLSALTAGRRLAAKNAPTVHKGVDSVASTVSDRVPTQHRSKVRKGASLVKKVLTGSSTTTTGPSPGEPDAPRAA